MKLFGYSTAKHDGGSIAQEPYSHETEPAREPDYLKDICRECGRDRSLCTCGGKSIERDNKVNVLYRIGAAAVLFLLALFLPVGDTVRAVLYGLSFLTVGYDVVLEAAKNILQLHLFDENLLMTIAAVCAFAIGERPEGAAVMLLFRIGGVLEDYAVGNSRKSIESLLAIKPDKAVVLRGEKETEIPAEAVSVGDTLIVRPGESIPLDGEVTAGESELDTSAITGEAMPRPASVGEKVLSGSINLSGLLKISVTAPFGESTVVRILKMVENINGKKARSERFIRRFAKVYTPAVLLAAILLAAVPPLFLHAPYLLWLKRALILLVVSCPCALVISVPLTYFAGIGASTKRGILFKSSGAMDDIGKATVAVLDKTGTLTSGKFGVTELRTELEDKNMLLRLAAHAEYFSKHPLAKSVVAAYSGKVDPELITNFTEIRGKGVAAKINGATVLAGTAAFLGELGIKSTDENLGESSVSVAVNGKYIGSIILADTPRKDAAAAVQALMKLGVSRIVMMTGDRQRSALKTAAAVGIKEVYAECLPEDKARKLTEIMEGNRLVGKLIYAGDGINDTPVISMADVGITVGGMSSDAAIEASDVVIMNDEPSKIAEAIKISVHTRKIVVQNVVFALVVKFAAMVLGVIGFLPMWGAVFADVGVTILAVLNASRAFGIRKIS